MSGTLQVGGITLGTHNSGTGKVDLTNAGATTVTTLNTTSIASGTLGSSVVVPASIGGTVVFLEKFTASNTSVKIFNLDSYTAFDSYFLNLNHVKPVSDDVRLGFFMGTGSSTFRESGGHYETFSHYGQYNGSSALESYDYNNSTIAFANNVSYDAGTGVSGIVKIYGALDSSVHTNCWYSLSFVKNTSYTISIQGAGTNLAQLDDAYIKCTYSSGNIDSGTIALYGVKDA